MWNNSLLVQPCLALQLALSLLPMLESQSCYQTSGGKWYYQALLPWLTSSSGAGLALTEAAITVPWVIAGVLIANLLVLHTSLGWRWCYYMGVIFGGASFLGTLIFYHPPPRPQFDFDKSRWQQFKSIDFVGLILYTAGLTTFLIGITWAGTPAHPWRSTSVIAPIILGLCTLIACFVYDFTIPKSPLFPREVFSQVRDFTLLLGVVFVAGKYSQNMQTLLIHVRRRILFNDCIAPARLSVYVQQ